MDVILLFAIGGIILCFAVLPHVPQTQFRYGPQPPVARHNPVRGFSVPFPPPPIVDEPQEGSAED